MGIFACDHPVYKFLNEAVGFFGNQDEYVIYGAYSLISISEFNSAKGFELSTYSSVGYSYKSLWQYSFVFQSEIDFIYGLPYDGLKLLDKNNYEYVIVEYIKRTALFKSLLNEILPLANSANDKYLKASKNIHPFTMTFSVSSTADTSLLAKTIEKLNSKYSFLNLTLTRNKSNSHENDDNIKLTYTFTKTIAKNVKVESEIKRLMLFDIFEACDYVYRSGGVDEFEVGGYVDINKLFTKNNAVEELAKFFYPDNPLESAKNQIYKLHREAKLRVYENELEKYFT